MYELDVGPRAEVFAGVAQGSLECRVHALEVPVEAGDGDQVEERVKIRSSSAWARARRLALSPSAPANPERTSPAARMIHGSPWAAPWSDCCVTRTSNRSPACRNVLRTVSPPRGVGVPDAP